MPTTKRTSIVTTNVRLDRVLHQQIKTAARQALRSLNAEIEARLRQSLGRRQKKRRVMRPIAVEQSAPPAAA
jgi:hypothetical protein